MGIEYKRVSEVLKEHEMQKYQLQFFNDRGSVIKFFCWQPKSKIEFDRSKGFYSTNSDHKSKVQSFLRTAKENKADIVISPEYSIPMEEIINILEKEELWPHHGKLWCLGMEGIPFDRIEEFDNIQNKNVVVIHEDLNDICSSEFFSCVAYLFLCKKKREKTEKEKI